MSKPPVSKVVAATLVMAALALVANPELRALLLLAQALEVDVLLILFALQSHDLSSWLRTGCRWAASSLRCGALTAAGWLARSASWALPSTGVIRPMVESLPAWADAFRCPTGRRSA